MEEPTPVQEPHGKANPKETPPVLINEKKQTRLTPLDSQNEVKLNFTVLYEDLVFEKRIGSPSAFGAVYKGVYRYETVAIKQFLLDDFSVEKQREIRKEASIMAGIQSDYLVRLRGVCLQKPHYCLLMDYLPQGDLYQLLQNQTNPLSLSQRYRLAADITIGLCRLHEQGIEHRDLKSLNVLLSEREGQLRAKLSDFGLSTLKKSLLHSQKGMVGSLPWLAPEIVKGTGVYGPATDVYSLRLVLYELVTGKVPYYGLPDKPQQLDFEQIKAWISADERPWNHNKKRRA